MKTTYKLYYAYQHVSFMVIIETRLWIGQSRNGVSVYSQSKTLLSFPRHPNRHCSPPSLLFSGHLGPSPRVKWFGHKSDHPHPSSATIKNGWSYTSNPHTLSRCAQGWLSFSSIFSYSGVPGRGGWGVQTPPQITKALQNRAKLNPIVKTVKNCWI